jgi:DNA-directed RNA polymerase alpha subunit
MKKNATLESLAFSVRTHAVLVAAGVSSVKDLTALTVVDLKKVPGLSRKGFREIVLVLQKKG